MFVWGVRAPVQCEDLSFLDSSLTYRFLQHITLVQWKKEIQSKTKLLFNLESWGSVFLHSCLSVLPDAWQYNGENKYLTFTGKRYLNIASSCLHWNKRSKIIEDYSRVSSSFVCPPLLHFDFSLSFYLSFIPSSWGGLWQLQLSSAQLSGAQGQNEPATAAPSPPIPMTNVCMQQDLAWLDKSKGDLWHSTPPLLHCGGWGWGWSNALATHLYLQLSMAFRRSHRHKHGSQWAMAREEK